MAVAICEECIHYDVCDAYTGEEAITFFPYNEYCKYFKSKDDYAEVRHGEWVCKGLMEICSLCDFVVWSDVFGNRHEYAHCPNCGAKMIAEE